MKLSLETIRPDSGSSFRILLNPGLTDLYYWHFHPEIEVVFVEAARGPRHIGNHVSTYEGSDLALIGSYIPHLNFDYGVKGPVETVVIQLREYFFDAGLEGFPELTEIRALFERVKKGMVFFGNTKQQAGERLKRLPSLGKFEQFVELMSIFQLLASSLEFQELQQLPLASQQLVRQQARMQQVYRFVEENYLKPVDTAAVARMVNMTLPAFCRYFKKNTRLSFTAFVVQYRISQAKRLLIQGQTVGEACYGSGFENTAYFNRAFKKLTGESPGRYKKGSK